MIGRDRLWSRDGWLTGNLIAVRFGTAARGICDGLTASGGHQSGVALSESAAIDSARRALGAELAAYRRAAGLNQSALATHVGYSRSTIANVETGRQHVPPDFWKRADAACRADGALTGASARVEAMARREREDAARQGRSAVLDPGRGTDAIHGEALEPLSGEIVPARGGRG